MLIKKEAKAEIKDVDGEHSLSFEVNFNEDYKDCVRIEMGGDYRVVKYHDLFVFMFAIATKEQQAKMIPVREELGYQYMKQIQVKLKNDMKEGEMLVVNVPINVPQIIEEQILLEKENKSLSTFDIHNNDRV